MERNNKQAVVGFDALRTFIGIALRRVGLPEPMPPRWPR